VRDPRNGPVKSIPVPGKKDENNAYLPEKIDLSIDSLLADGLRSIHGVMKGCLREATTSKPSRESVMNLKDCVAMLRDLKADEQELLETMSDADLKKAVEDVD